MADDLSPRVQEIFDAARALPPHRRRAYLDEACKGDRDLRGQVESLLEFDSRGADFLETPALGTGFHVHNMTVPQEKAAGLEGCRLGSYRVDRLIGEGGMSRVYRAHRDDAEFRKQVAIKVIKPGMDTGAVISRFRRERQALASLDHPNIARLLDGGSTEEGHPYLVMEYIEGEPLTVYCDRERLPTVKRLELFRQVCAAVEHAHRNMVLHRDLKPGNILVTEDGVPKLLDFGIAKILHPETQTRSYTLTTPTQRFYTPEYASPEQIRGESISTATDVYSLGVVLYEILTGRRPLRLTTLAPHEVERVICEVDPPRPSTAIGRVEEIRVPSGETVTLSPESVSRTRDGRPDRLRRRLSGDVDNIVMMALRKEPDRRYASVEQLSGDIRRHLEGLPVTARRDTLLYRTGKFATRHRATAASLAFTLVLVGVVGGGLFSRWRARRALARETAQRVLLEVTGAGSRKECLHTLDIGVADEAAAGLASQPAELLRFTRDVAGLCTRFHLDRFEIKWRKREIAAGKSLGIPPGERAAAHLALARSLHRLADLAGAREQAAIALRLAGKSPGGEPLLASRALRRLALVQQDQGDFDQAAKTIEESLARLPESSPARVPLMLELADVLLERGDANRALTRVEAAARSARAAPAGDRPLLEAAVEESLGRVLWRTPRCREAEVHARAAFETFDVILPAEEPRRVRALEDLALLASYQSHSAAESIWRLAWEQIRHIYGEGTPERIRNQTVLARIVADSTRRYLIPQILGSLRKRLPPDHPAIAALLALQGACLDTNDVTRDLPRGEALLREALRIEERTLGPDHVETARTSADLGSNLGLQGRFEEGLALLTPALKVLERRLGPAHPWTNAVLRQLADTLEQSGDSEGARRCRTLGRERSRAARSAGRIADHDWSMEDYTEIDFEDSYAEKRIIVPEEDLQDVRQAVLWVFGMPWNYRWRDFTGRENLRLRVNGDPAREIPFNPGRKYAYVTNAYQWASIEIPVSWVVAGENSFILYHVAVPDYADSCPWEYDNLYIGIDRDSRRHRSWWFGRKENSCCLELQRASMDASVRPLGPRSPLIVEHREQGFRECEGELMIHLELSRQ